MNWSRNPEIRHMLHAGEPWQTALMVWAWPSRRRYAWSASVCGYKGCHARGQATTLKEACKAAEGAVMRLRSEAMDFDRWIASNRDRLRGLTDAGVLWL